ncbi:MAG: RnfABCDGE type electron transport complex subunit D [Bacteroidales bacterium]|nr:RnfABCDGE type electron transport complex subunit D [Bacteroidales bacterium]
MGTLLTISGSPHVHSSQSVRKIMYSVFYAMIPAMLVSFYFFGLDAVRVMAISVIACILVEYLIQRYVIKGDLTINDGSAIVTGVLLAFNVPTNLPTFIIIIGAVVAIGIAKMAFGGLGKNPFNPALVGRVFLLISFPVQMTSWPVIKPLFAALKTDAVSGATLLGFYKENFDKIATTQETVHDFISAGLPQYDELGTVVSHQVLNYQDLLLGQMGGSMGEVSAIALLLGAAFMFYKKVITWQIPVSYLASSLLFAFVFWLIDPELYLNPVYHLMAGGLMLGIFFMATDMVSSPMSAKGQIVYGIGCGVITMVIRFWGGYPEGVSFAILIMNAFAPLINTSFKPARFGVVKVTKA